MAKHFTWPVMILVCFSFLISCGGGGGSSAAEEWGEVVKLSGSDADNYDGFGNAVSIDGDYLIVGSYGNNAGAAYIFSRDEGGVGNWGEVTKINASDAETGDLFGKSVSMSGDYVIVGASKEAAGGTNAGAAYIFYRDQGGADNWGEVAKINASDAEADDWFGESVSMSGDCAIVGSRWEDAMGDGSGAAYVFCRDQGGVDNWGEIAKITASDAEADDHFGSSVSMSGDYAIVGATLEDAGGINAGAAYIFYRDQGGVDNWGEVAKITASDAEADDHFGSSVSVSGSYAIVGAKNEDTSGSSAGAAYIFYRDQGGADNWGEVTKITASDAETGDLFGESVSMSGDYAIVGASKEAASGTNAGAAYIFWRDQGGVDNWGEVTKIITSDAEADDHFGESVSMSGDYAIVGAIWEDAGGTDVGAAYVFER